MPRDIPEFDENGLRNCRCATCRMTPEEMRAAVLADAALPPRPRRPSVPWSEQEMKDWQQHRDLHR